MNDPFDQFRKTEKKMIKAFFALTLLYLLGVGSVVAFVCWAIYKVMQHFGVV